MIKVGCRVPSISASVMIYLHLGACDFKEERPSLVQTRPSLHQWREMNRKFSKVPRKAKVLVKQNSSEERLGALVSPLPHK